MKINFVPFYKRNAAIVMLLAIFIPSVGLATSLLEFENLTEDIGRGFGDNWNRYAFSMGEDDGHVYVGTWNVQLDYPKMMQAIRNGELGDIVSGGNPLEGIGFLASEGAEIWRHDGGQNWTQVAKSSEDNTGFRKMLSYNGQLYAGSANSESGAELWVKKIDGSLPQGESWEMVSSWAGAGKSPDNNSIRALATYTDSSGKEYLYVGTENNKDGAELWAYDGTTWELKEKFTDNAVSEIAVFKDTNGDEKMYVGTWNFEVNLNGVPTDTFQLYASSDGDGFENVKPEYNGKDSLSNLGVMKLIEYNGKLYLGTVNYSDGFTLLSSNDPSNINSWTTITTDGFGDSDNAYSWSAAVMDDKLLFGTFNSGLTGGQYSDTFPMLPLDGRAQLLYTTDGLSFDTLIDDGFGGQFNYGFRNMLVSGGRLYVGTASNFFIPDFSSSLYDPYMDYLASLEDMNLSPAVLETYLAGINSPFIGTQIWASQPVPEPTTMLLFGTGLVGLFGAKYRRKKK